MLEVITFALEIVYEESSQLELEMNWNKTPESLQGAPLMVPVLGHQVEVDSFIYLRSCIEPGGT